MTWLQDLAELWAGGQEDHCVFGHVEHARIDRSTIEFGPMTVYDWKLYEDQPPGYCSGRDEFSKAIDVNHGWDRPATQYVKEILEGRCWTDDVVLDFGSHIGWYSLLAANYGYDHYCESYPVLAVDADPERLDLLRLNARRLSAIADDLITTCRGWIGPDTPVCPLPPEGTRVRFLKADVEGAEADVLRIVEPLIRARLIDALLIEVSPVFTARGFGCDYGPVVQRLLDAGYGASLIPGNTPEFSLERLADPVGFLDTIEQADLLFQLEDR